MASKIKISVVMASFLGAYTGAATWRERKICRAIDSFLNQSYKNAELIIVSDGCKLTKEIVLSTYSMCGNIRILEIDKQPLWSGLPRTAGIMAATGDYVCYLDTDDYLGNDHLKIIAEGLQGNKYAWAWFNNKVLFDYKEPTEEANALIQHKCGTCNIVHKSSINDLWNVSPTYLHDWEAIRKLMQHEPHAQIATPEYIICHLPKVLDR